MLSFSPYLLELNSDFIEGFCDDSNEDILHHPRQEEDHGDEVEGGFPGVETVGGPVHDVDPALLRGRLVHREYTRGELPEAGEANVAPVASVSEVHAAESLPSEVC